MGKQSISLKHLLATPWPGLLAFKLNWLVLVLGQNHLLPVSALLLIPLQSLLLPGSPPQSRARTILGCLPLALAGIMMDQLLGLAGVFEFPNAGIPAWLALLWLAFSLALQNLSQLLLPLKTGTLVIVSSITGTVAYAAGNFLGIIHFGYSTAFALTLIAICWSLVLPAQRAMQLLLPSRITATRLLVTALLFCMVAVPAASPASAEEPAWVTIGKGTFRKFFLTIYDARLEAQQADFQFPQTRPFALTLFYKRDIASGDIIDNTLDQWRKQQVAWPKSWESGLLQAIPGIKKGDNLRLVVGTGQTATLLHNGNPVATFTDPAFVTAFAGIWLAENTTAPELRRQLLGNPP